MQALGRCPAESLRSPFDPHSLPQLKVTHCLTLTPEHSVNYVRSMFRVKGRRIMVRAVVEEALALTSVSLFLAMVAVWVQVLGVI